GPACRAAAVVASTTPRRRHRESPAPSGSQTCLRRRFALLRRQIRKRRDRRPRPPAIFAPVHAARSRQTRQQSSIDPTPARRRSGSAQRSASNAWVAPCRISSKFAVHAALHAAALPLLL